MPETIDPETLDVHKFEKKQVEVLPLTKKEKISPRTLEGITAKPEKESRHGKIFLSIIGNIILPGLGNLFFKKTMFGNIVLSINILLLILTVSPVSLLGWLWNVASPRNPPIILGTSIITSESTNTTRIEPAIAIIIWFAMALSAIAWLHLGYLILKKKDKKSHV